MILLILHKTHTQPHLGTIHYRNANVHTNETEEILSKTNKMHCFSVSFLPKCFISLSNHFIPTVMKHHLPWETTHFSGRFIQASLYHSGTSMFIGIIDRTIQHVDIANEDLRPRRLLLHHLLMMMLVVCYHDILLRVTVQTVFTQHVTTWRGTWLQTWANQVRGSGVEVGRQWLYRWLKLKETLTPGR